MLEHGEENRQMTSLFSLHVRLLCAKAPNRDKTKNWDLFFSLYYFGGHESFLQMDSLSCCLIEMGGEGKGDSFQLSENGWAKLRPRHVFCLLRGSLIKSKRRAWCVLLKTWGVHFEWKTWIIRASLFPPPTSAEKRELTLCGSMTTKLFPPSMRVKKEMAFQRNSFFFSTKTK